MEEERKLGNDNAAYGTTNGWVTFVKVICVIFAIIFSLLSFFAGIASGNMIVAFIALAAGILVSLMLIATLMMTAVNCENTEIIADNTAAICEELAMIRESLEKDNT